MKEEDISKLKVVELRAELGKRGISVKGTKPVLLKRLGKALGQSKSLKKEKERPAAQKNDEDSYEDWLHGQKSGKVPNCYNDKFKKQKSHAYAGSITNGLYQSFFNVPIKEETVEEEEEVVDVEEDEEILEDEKMEDCADNDDSINEIINIKEEPSHQESENESDNLFESKMDIKAEIFSDDENGELETSVNYQKETPNLKTLEGYSGDIEGSKFLKLLTENAEFIWAEEMPTDNLDLKPFIKIESPFLKNEPESEATSNTFIWDEETSLFHEKQEKDDDDPPVEVLTVIEGEDEEEDEIIDLDKAETSKPESSFDDISIGDKGTVVSEEIDEALEIELLRGDTPVVPNTNSVKETAAEKKFDDNAADADKTQNVASSNEQEEIIIEDSPDPASVEEVSPSPEVINVNTEDNSPKSPDAPDGGNQVIPASTSVDFAIDKRPEIAISDDDTSSFIRLDVGNESDMYSHGDNNDDGSVSMRVNVEGTSVKSGEKDDLIIEKEITKKTENVELVIARKENVADASRKSAERGYLSEKYKKDLEERELRELKQQRERLLVLDRKQKYEAERLEREKEKLRLEKERLAREKNELIRKELELERQRLETEKKQLRKERLKYKSNNSHEESSSLGNENQRRMLRAFSCSRAAPEHDSSLLRFATRYKNGNHGNRGEFSQRPNNRYTTSNNFQTDTGGVSQDRDHFTNRYASKKSPHRFHNADKSKYLNDETQSLRHFYYGSLKDRNKGHRGSVPRSTYNNKRPRRASMTASRLNLVFDRYGSRSRSRSRTRSRSMTRSRSRSRSRFTSRTRSQSRYRSRTRSRSRHRQICHTRSRSKSRPRFRSRTRSKSRCRSKSRSRCRSRSRSRSRSVELVDIDERQDWVSDDETDRFGNPRSYSRNARQRRNTDVPSPSSIVCLDTDAQDYPNRDDSDPFSENSFNDNTTNFVKHRPFNRKNSMFKRRGGNNNNTNVPGRRNPTCNSQNFTVNQNSYQPSTSRYRDQNNLTVVQSNDRRPNNFLFRGRGRRFNKWKSPFQEPDSSSYWR